MHNNNTEKNEVSNTQVKAGFGQGAFFTGKRKSAGNQSSAAECKGHCKSVVAECKGHCK